jgi:hypothetical protein
VVGVADNVERTERAAIFGVTMVNNIQKGGGSSRTMYVVVELDT